jgi:hypothetical protein
MGGRKERLLDAIVRISRNDSLMRLEDERLHDDHMSAAAQAIVARVLRLAFILRMRDRAVRVWQEVAGEDLHGSEEHEKHRRAAKRPAPKAHLLLSCHIRSSGLIQGKHSSAAESGRRTSFARIGTRQRQIKQ